MPVSVSTIIGERTSRHSMDSGAGMGGNRKAVISSVIEYPTPHHGELHPSRVQILAAFDGDSGVI